MRLHRRRLALFAFLLLAIAAVVPGTRALGQPVLSVAVPAQPVPEARDFATRVLGDPWDMAQYSDISQYLNESGQRRMLSNPKVQNGVFSGISLNDATTGDGNAYFYPLFPGYGGVPGDPVVQLGKTGLRYPIDASTYRCLNVALKSNSGPATGGGPDLMRVFWFADQLLNAPGKQWGFTYDVLYPEAGAAQPTVGWRLHTINLASPPNGVPSGFTPWTARANWIGLRIDPTSNRPNTSFEVDWVRLTDCAPVNRTITWTPKASITHVWLQPVGADRKIRLPNAVNGNSGSASVDLQGVAPGRYLVGLGGATACCDQISGDELVINQTPIAAFAQPSATSGADYAAQVGNPWDFADSSDATVTRFRSGTPQPAYAFENDALTIVTPPGPLPAGIDVATFLNLPAPTPTSQYRYLSIRMYTDGAWQNVPEAMIGRWIWSTPGTSGRPGFRCTLVGADIPLDVGWQTYTIDLYDAASNGGLAEDRQGECPAGALNWQSMSPALALRFDPNENVTGALNPKTPAVSLLQKIDWIKLTAENVVSKGTPYAIKLGLNKPAGQITSRTFYYTSSPQQPTQHIAEAFSAPPPAGANRVYLPLAGRPGAEGEPIANPLQFVWDTSGVAPGAYYVCAALDDGTNTSTFCSDVTITVQ
jgi:hypothetical protein